MTARVYSSPPAFKQALEQRLKAASKDGVDFARRRQLLAFDRFLARVSAAFGNSVLLKGGLVLELRLERARTTKDVDLKVTGSPAKLLASLQLAGQQDLGDFMTFEVNPDAEHPIIDNDGMQYEGQRFRAECRLAGKLYGQRFGVDVASSDPVFGEPDIVTAYWLAAPASGCQTGGPGNDRIRPAAFEGSTFLMPSHPRTTAAMDVMMWQLTGIQVPTLHRRAW